MKLNRTQAEIVEALLANWANECINQGLLPSFLLAYPNELADTSPRFFTLNGVDLGTVLPRELERIAHDLRLGDFTTTPKATSAER